MTNPGRSGIGVGEEIAHGIRGAIPPASRVVTNRAAGA
jgi:hypothetical protein